MDEKSPKKKSNLKRWVQIIGSVAAGGLFIWLMAQQNWHDILSTLKRLPIWIWLTVLVLHVAHAMWNTLRWNVLLHAKEIDLSYAEASKLQFASLFASNFLPSSVGGDVVRVVALRKHGADLTIGLASIVVDRLINIIGVLLFLPTTFIVFAPMFRNGEIDFRASFALMGFWEKLKTWWSKFFDALGYWLKKPQSIILSLLITVAAVFTLCLSHWLLAKGLGMDVNFMEVVAIRTFAYFVMMIPISLNGLGLRELGMTTLYIAVGATPAQAVSFALITRLFLILRTLPGALWVSPALMQNDTTDAGQTDKSSPTPPV